MSDVIASVIFQDYHRNGVGGRGFVVSLVKWEYGRGEPMEEGANPFVTISFGSTRQEFVEQTAVLSIPYLLEGNIEFANGNSWRGSDCLGPVVADAWYEKCMNSKVPYDPWKENSDAEVVVQDGLTTEGLSQYSDFESLVEEYVGGGYNKVLLWVERNWKSMAREWMLCDENTSVPVEDDEDLAQIARDWIDATS